jgi:hypothetical protein
MSACSQAQAGGEANAVALQNDPLLLLALPIRAAFQGIGGLLFAAEGALSNSGWTLTRTVAAHAAERPYVNSGLLIDEIVGFGGGVPDAFVAGALRFEMAGSWAGTFGVRQGNYELVVNPQTRTVYHFLFRSTK